MDTNIGTDSPPLRSTILGSFLGRGRPRNSSQSNTNANAPDPLRELSPSPTGAYVGEHGLPPLSPGAAQNSYRRRTGMPTAVAGSASGTGTGTAGGTAASPGAGTPGSTAAAAAASGVGAVQPSASQSAPGSGLGFSNMLRRRRSAGAVGNANANNGGAPVPGAPPARTSTSTSRPPAPTSNPTSNNAPQLPVGPPSTSAHPAHAPAPPSAPGTHRVRLVPHLESRRSLKFDAITRDLRPGDTALRIGRFTDRSGLGLAAVNALGSNKLAFKSKVVSRAHAEIWVEGIAPSANGGVAGGVKFLIKDTKSSSGTFLNHMRLSPANTESRPHQIKDGDILQLGVDYQGGTEDIYKSVKIRIELGREWQAGANKFNTTAIKNLKSLAQAVSAPTKAPTAGGAGGKSAALPDCCICLFSISIRQALFIAPCSHTFHYKCIRPLVESHFPGFCCPLCRTFADLEEDVEVEHEEEEWEEGGIEEGDMNMGDVEEAAPTNTSDAQVHVEGGVQAEAPAGREAEDEDSAVEDSTPNPAAHVPGPSIAAAQAVSSPAASAAFISATNAMAAARERERERDLREREAGAETEVEGDGQGSTIRARRIPAPAGIGGGGRARGHGRNLSAQMDPMEFMEEADEDEADLHGQLQLHNANVHREDEDHEMIDVDGVDERADVEFVDVGADSDMGGGVEAVSSGSGHGSVEGAVVGIGGEEGAGAKRKR